MKFWGKKEVKPPSVQAPTFKSTFSLAERVEKHTSMRQKYPQQKFCAIVIEGMKDLPFTTQSPKPYILMGVQRIMTVLRLIAYVKKMLSISESTSLFVQVGGNIIPMTTTMGELSQKFRENDKFVYLKVKTEDIF